MTAYLNQCKQTETHNIIHIYTYLHISLVFETKYVFAKRVKLRERNSLALVSLSLTVPALLCPLVLHVHKLAKVFKFKHTDATLATTCGANKGLISSPTCSFDAHARAECAGNNLITKRQQTQKTESRMLCSEENSASVANTELPAEPGPKGKKTGGREEDARSNGATDTGTASKSKPPGM